MTDKQNVARFNSYEIMWSQDGFEPKSSPNGEWVSFSDYEALSARLAEVKADRDFWENRENEALLRAEAAEAERDRCRENQRETWEAMVTMRNSINEHVPMPSLEADLLNGPETSVFCTAVAEAVIKRVRELAAAAQARSLNAAVKNKL